VVLYYHKSFFQFNTQEANCVIGIIYMHVHLPGLLIKLCKAAAQDLFS